MIVAKKENPTEAQSKTASLVEYWTEAGTGMLTVRMGELKLTLVAEAEDQRLTIQPIIAA